LIFALWCLCVTMLLYLTGLSDLTLCVIKGIERYVDTEKEEKVQQIKRSTVTGELLG